MRDIKEISKDLVTAEMAFQVYQTSNIYGLTSEELVAASAMGSKLRARLAALNMERDAWIDAEAWRLRGMMVEPDTEEPQQ